MTKSSLDRRAFLSLTAGAAALPLVHPVAAWAKSRPSDDLTGLTLHEAATRVRRRDVSPVELTKACLARIEQYDAQIKAFITVTSPLALEQARAAEQEIRQGRWRGPLHGIPIALKDNIDTGGIRTTLASAEFIDRIPTQDAEVVRRLKQAGAVSLGKLNIGFAPSHWGSVHNPWALNYECGYSSSGSAAAVAADFCFGTLGTDLCGSVRIPASACGVVGLKASYGLVSNRGANLNNIDPTGHVGPLCKTVLDTALLLQGMVGYDPNWVDSVQVDLPDYATALRENIGIPRLGIPKGSLDKLDPEVAQLTNAALKMISTLGTIENDDVNVPLYWEIVEGLGIHEQMLPHVVAHRAMQEARSHAADLFEGKIDFLVSPTWTRLPMTVEMRDKTYPLKKEDYMHEWRNTMPFNVLGLPAISVPCGFTKGGLPVGLQIVGPLFSDARVLAFAHAYEQATKWHLRKPQLMALK